MSIVLRRPPEETTEGHHTFYLVPLAASDFRAKVDIEDYHRIASEFTPQWQFNTGAVRLMHEVRGSLRVARLIMNPPEDHRVHLRNRDPLDLRRSNLELRPFKRRKVPPQSN